MTANDDFGTSSFNTAGKWSDSSAPSAGNDYYIGDYYLRTPPDGSNHTFAGDSLTVDNTGGYPQGMLFKGTGTTGSLTINNLILDGGIVSHGNGSGDIFNLYGNINVASDSQIYAKQGPINVYSTITGSSAITNPGSDGDGRTLYIHASDNTFTGSIVNNGRFELVDGALLNFVIGASGVNNGISGTGASAVYDGDFSFDLSGAGTGLGDSWVIANASSQTFGDNFTAVGFTDQGDGHTWLKFDNGVWYKFDETGGSATLEVVPEPATMMLLGLGSLALIRRRRA
jgi:hypothetical protein